MALEGRVALVTGSGRNIGRAIALALAGQGASVVVHARSNRDEAESVAQEVRQLGGRALPLLADLGEREQVEAMLERALGEFGVVDILVNNVAMRGGRPVGEMTYQEWHAILAVDLDAAFLTAHALTPGMLAQGWGRIINLGGLNAMEGRAGSVAVSAAKMGLVGLTRALAWELGPGGVLVNCVVPGAINGGRRPAPIQGIEARLPDIPVGRLGSPSDIAQMCLFLCTDEASFISGQTISVNGGQRVS